MSQPPPDPGLLPRPHGRLRLRLGALGVAVVVLFMLLVLRLWALQVLNTRTFVAQAASNHEKQVVVRAPRGEILDGKGRVLVRNRVAYELDLDPGAVRDTRPPPRSCCCASRTMLDLPPRPLWERVDRQLRIDPVAPGHARHRHRREAQVVPAGEPGASSTASPWRRCRCASTPTARSARTSTASSPRSGPSSCEDPRFHDYHRGDVIGQSGVERRYDAFLRGDRRRRRRDGRRVRPADRRRAARQGAGAGPQRPPHDRPRHAARGRAGARERRARARPRTAPTRARSSRSTRTPARSARSPRIPTFDPNWFISYRKPKFQRQLARITRDGGDAGALPAARPRDRRPLSGRLDVQAVRRDRGGQGAARHAPTRRCRARRSRYYYHKRSATGTRRSTAAST